MRFFLITILLFWSAVASADSRDTVTAAVRPEVVEVGKPFRYDVTLSTFTAGDLGLASAPGFGSLEILGREEYPQFLTINKVSRRVLTVSWTLRSRKTGEFSISAPKVKLGKTQTQPDDVSIKVVAAGKVPREVKQKNEQLFVESTVHPKDRVYVGQQVTVSYAVYNDMRMFDPQLRAANDPALDAFWVEPINERLAGQRQSVPVQGRLMERTLLRNYALFPLKSGPATVDAMSVTVATGGFMSSGREFTVESTPHELNVLPLPPNAPAGFHEGNVGQFTFQASTSTQRARVGEAFTLRLTVSGAGLASRVKAPVLPALKGARVSVPVENDQKGTRGETVVGTKRVEYPITPTAPGRLVIPSMTFVYFDPQSGTYETAKSAEIVLEVADGVLPAEAGPVTPVARAATSSTADELIEAELEGLAGPRREPITRTRDAGTSPWFWGLLGLGLLGILLSSLEFPWRRWRARSAPVRQMNELFDRALASIENAAHANELAAGLRNTLAEAFKLPAGRTNASNLGKALKEHDVSDDTVETLVGVLSEIEGARFAPGGAPADLPGLKARARSGLQACRAAALTLARVVAVLVFIWTGVRPAEAATPFELAEQKKYAEAAAAWQQAAADSDDPLDHYNAGVMYAHAGDWGHARAHLETAEFLAPGTATISEQLTIVRNVVRLRAIESTRVGRVLEGDDALFWWRAAARVPPRPHAYLTLVLVLGAAAAMALWRFRRHEKSKTPALILSGLAALMLLSWTTTTYVISTTQAAVLVTAEPDFRDGPSELAASRKVRGVTAGTMLRVAEARPGWIRLVLTNEKDTTWVPSSHVQTIH